MFKFVKERLSLKTSLTLAAAAVPLMAGTGYAVVRAEEQAVQRLVLQKGRIIALAGAAAMRTILMNGLNDGAIVDKDGTRRNSLTLADLLSPSYVDYKFEGITDVPIRSTSSYSRYVKDHGVSEVEDAFLEDPDIVYASMIDKHGLVGAPHSRNAQNPNGNPEHDKKNRADRVYDGEPLNAAKFSPGPTDRQVWIQDYHRDTGEEIWDVVAPIEIGGKHFGGFRVGISKEQVQGHTWELTVKLIVSFGILVSVLGLITMSMVQWWMRPLVNLARKAESMSTDADGRILNEEISVVSIDEIGKMGKALNRLRISLRAAMAAIGA